MPKNQNVVNYSLILTTEPSNVVQSILSRIQADLLQVKELCSALINSISENPDLLLNSYTFTALFFIMFVTKQIKSCIFTCMQRYIPPGEKESVLREDGEEKFIYVGGFGFTRLEPKT